MGIQSAISQETGILSGVLRDEFTGGPLFAVKVTCGGHLTRSDEDGIFYLSLSPGMHDVFLDRYGLQEMILPGIVIMAGDTSLIDTIMHYIPVPPAFVQAEIMDDNTWVQVSWTASGPDIVEDYIDDGEVDDFFIYQQAGGQVSNKFSNNNHQFGHIIGGRYFVGDGSFPGPFLNSQLLMRVYDDRGMSGKPGNLLKEDTVTVDQYGWIGFDSLDAWCNTDNYYLGFYQMLNSPESAPIGIEMDIPTYADRSWMKFGENGWDQLFSGNAMIRSWVAQPHDSVHNIGCRIARYSNFDPNGNPAAGTITELSSQCWGYYNDYAIAGMGGGCYAYGVKELYEDLWFSEYKISNTICIWPKIPVSIDLSLTGGSLLKPVIVDFIALDQYHHGKSLSIAQPGTGNYLIPRGAYRLEVHSPGFKDYRVDTICIINDTLFAVQLQQLCTPVSSPEVFPFTGLMEWAQPHAYLYEWYCDTPLTCHGHTLPELDLTGAEDWILSVNYFIQPSYNPVYLEFSTDRGENWEVLYILLPENLWRITDIDLQALSGSFAPQGIIFRIRESGNGMTQCLLLDHVWVWSPSMHSQPKHYSITLDGVFVDTTSAVFYQLHGLVSGQTYRAGVQAVYGSCHTDTAFVDFTYYPLFPPENLSGYEENDSLYLYWSPPSDNWIGKPTNYPDALAGYKLSYLTLYNYNEVEIFIDGPVDTALAIHRLNCDSTSITVTAVYDISSYGYPGELVESGPCGPLGFPAYDPIAGEFTEDWSSLDFFAQCWTADDLFMSVSPDQGVPGGGFVYISPDIAGYTTSLTSHPLHIEQSPDWQTILEFDLRLTSNYWSGDEFLEIQVFPEGISQWSTIHAINNSLGSIPWQNFTFNLGDFFAEDDFRLRFLFTSNGNESANWYLDNIRVHPFCRGPATITATMQSTSRVLLSWEDAFTEGQPKTLDSYRLYRNHDGSGYEMITETTSASFMDDLETGGQYCYYVLARYLDNGTICESSASDSACITVFLGVEEDDAPGVRIFPNPASDIINVLTETDGMHLEIYNPIGGKILEYDSREKQTRIDVSEFHAGVYYLIIQTKEGLLGNLLIIQ
jgi:hypothetical protein